MKKIILTFLCGCALSAVHAQNAVTDTVSTGAQYADQVWYSLENGTKTAVPKTDWDIAFRTNEIMSVAIIINDGAGTELWKYPGDTSAWSTLDTAGIATWDQAYNSETDWETGAFNALSGSSQFDYGWGEYDVNTHDVNGNALFVIRLSDGSYRKIWIQQLDLGETYIFKYAGLDGANEQEVTLEKSAYANKNFGYYSLQNNQALDPEPDSDDWDLLFTQYTAFIPAGQEVMPYVVTGVLSNDGVTGAKAEHVDAASYTDYESQTLEQARNLIGYDWKAYDMSANAYVIADSTVFFVQDKNEAIWKLVFTGFGGSADGNFIFSKEKLTTTAIHDATGDVGSMAVYPNPVSSEELTVAFSLKESRPARLYIYDYSGRCVFHKNVNARRGMNRETFSMQSLPAGIYLLTLEAGSQKASQKIVVR